MARSAARCSTGSNNTKTSHHSAISADDFAANYVNYGVREHGMAAAMNGMALWWLVLVLLEPVRSAEPPSMDGMVGISASSTLPEQARVARAG